jgi:hypothetical protein
MKTRTYLKGHQKKEMIALFMDGYNCEQLAERFSVCYKTALETVRPTRVLMRTANNAAKQVAKIQKANGAIAPAPVVEAAPVKKDRNIPISLEAEDFIVGLSLVYNISRMQVVDMLVSHARVKFASL